MAAAPGCGHSYHFALRHSTQGCHPVWDAPHGRPFSASRDGGSVLDPTAAEVPPGPTNGPHGGGASMKDLIKQYLDNGMSRRQLMTGLSALGMSNVAVKSVAQSLET